MEITRKLLGRFLDRFGGDASAANNETNGTGRKKDPPTPTAFQARWLTFDELVQVTDTEERNALAASREERWRADLGGSGYSGIRR